MNKADLYKAYRALEQSHMKLEMELNDIKKENEELQKEVDYFKISMIKSTNEKYDEWKEDTENYVITSLKEENKKLKEENKILKNATSSYEDLLAGDDGTIDKIEELKAQLKNTQEENKDNYIQKLTLQRVSQFYNGLHPDGVSIVDAMDWLDEHFDIYGVDKYKMFVDALDYIVGIQEHQLFDEDEIRKEYEELYDDGEITGDKLDLIEDIIECLEDYDKYHSYFELNVNKPCDGREDGIRVWYNNMV